MGESAVIRPCGEADFGTVVELGDRFKKFLGLFPHDAYRTSIQAECIYGAFVDGELAGYVLFDLPRSDVRLIHLCIKPDYRGKGLARRLVDEIQLRHGHRECIRLKCRRDYEAHAVWPKLGFQAQSFPVGRGKDKAEMTAFRRSFDHDDLFSVSLAEDPRVQVAMDTNVVMDVLLKRKLETEEFLDSPMLQGEVAYCISHSVRNELSGIEPASLRRRVVSQLGQYEELRGELSVCDALYSELLQAIPSAALRKDPSLRADARLAAETIVSGAAVMITNDDNAARILRPLALQHGVHILHPSQLLLVIDELKGTRRDATERIQNTEMTIGQAPAGIDRELDHLISAHSGETKTRFRGLVRSKMGSDMRIVHASKSRLADALIVTSCSAGVLELEMLRVRRAPLGPTLLKQLLFQLRHEALRRGALRIILTDPAPGGGESYTEILEQEGAKFLDGNWTIEVVDVQLDVDDLHTGRFADWDLTPWLQNPLKTPTDYARLEHQLWPLKIRNAPLECYVVPIKQTYASELLGYDTPLLARNQDLGISRRHVYYKSAPQQPKAPGRILWYASGPLGHQVVAASQLVSSHRASPGALHRRFQKYGVWSLADIETHAGKADEAVALRFGDTEVFPSPIKLSDACQWPIVCAHGRPAKVPAGGRENCLLMATRSAHRVFGGVGHVGVWV
ncbi:GNAT family N-acetyltransferase [Arthrobacter sp. ATA002]|uniref:GNAT family N-acetyltransferase n=1 Tax=Arthrobacter sp. ATA002 TaxID=2991715 RepID=UPI0022A6807D|nr:GNAT family N-acetyltransferase [Arthrobacter sp. ATA002]WAP53041.1 GNAT family N-acetyltransferase [Arthrobacter sp. ATA002]